MMYHRIHFLYDSLNCYFKMEKTTKTEETKEVVSYLIITPLSQRQNNLKSHSQQEGMWLEAQVTL